MSKFLEEIIVPENTNHKIQNYFKYIKKNYQNPDWVETLNNMNNDSKIYYLSNNDFKSGTFRVKNPGRYILLEDIIFNPNPENNFQPYSYQTKYYNKFTYSLGFFAAITIESNNVTIDLNNHSIQQSKEHYKNQESEWLKGNPIKNEKI